MIEDSFINFFGIIMVSLIIFMTVQAVNKSVDFEEETHIKQQ